MNKITKETFTRSDIELSLKKEFPNLNEDVINYLAKDSNSNIRELIGVFNRIVAFSKMSKKQLNVNDCKILYLNQ